MPHRVKSMANPGPERVLQSLCIHLHSLFPSCFSKHIELYIMPSENRLLLKAINENTDFLETTTRLHEELGDLLRLQAKATQRCQEGTPIACASDPPGVGTSEK